VWAVRGDPLPAAHHVARHCRHIDLIWTNGNATGVKESAFEPKQGEADGLSTNWLEFFGGDRQRNLSGVRGVTKLVTRNSHRIAVINVGTIVTADPSAKLSVVEDPIDPPALDANPAHALIKEATTLHDQAVRDVLAFIVQQSDLETY
jgi:hypothetical protein